MRSWYVLVAEVSITKTFVPFKHEKFRLGSPVLADWSFHRFQGFSRDPVPNWFWWTCEFTCLLINAAKLQVLTSGLLFLLPPPPQMSVTAATSPGWVWSGKERGKLWFRWPSSPPSPPSAWWSSSVSWSTGGQSRRESFPSSAGTSLTGLTSPFTFNLATCLTEVPHIFCKRLLLWRSCCAVSGCDRRSSFHHGPTKKNLSSFHFGQICGNIPCKPVVKALVRAQWQDTQGIMGAGVIMICPFHVQ